MYRSSRINYHTVSNMQGFMNQGHASNFSGNNTMDHATPSFPRSDWIGGRTVAAERITSQTVVRSLPLGENDRIPHSGNAVGSFHGNIYAGTSHITDGGRRSCKRKSPEGILWYPSRDVHPHFLSREGSSVARFLDHGRHDLSIGSGAPVSGTLTASLRESDLNMLRHGSLSGSDTAADYRGNAFTGRGLFESSQRSVRSRSISLHHQEANMQQPLENGRRFQGGSHSFVQQPLDMEMHEMSSVIRRRALVPGERNRHVGRIGSQITSFMPAEASFTSSASTGSSLHLSGSNGVSEASSGSIPGLRNNALWHYPQPLHIQSAGMTSGFQRTQYSRSLLHRSYQNRHARRSALDMPIERGQPFQHGDSSRSRSISDDLPTFETSAFYSSFDVYDRHRDMRLDVDNMTYEELLALEERIGSVNTGLTDETVSKCLTIKRYLASTEVESTDENTQKCSICQEEYEVNDEIGTLKCGHEHHTQCIMKWLLQKNECPICKAPASKNN